MELTSCRLCPRNCGADRTTGTGFCGGGRQVRLARAALHHWEEPCISGTRGSGTIFFSGCPMRCCFCQNYQISAECFGKEVSQEHLAEIVLSLQAQGGHNINLVSPLHYAPWVADMLREIKPQLTIPVVCNTGGYETVETLKMMEGLVDIYLPDLKYHDPARAARYSGAPDYVETAHAAILEMYRQTGPVRLDDEGILERGMVVRHLVMPGGWRDSVAVLDWIAGNLPLEDILVSVMSQYTPFYRSNRFREINRRVSTYEYNRVMEHAQMLGIRGFMQEKSSAQEEYTPAFDLEGI